MILHFSQRQILIFVQIIFILCLFLLAEFTHAGRQSVDTVLNYGTFKDKRDNNTYKTVQFGSQVWMAENLAYLPSVSPSSQGSMTDPHYYVYGYQDTSVVAAGNTNNYKNYGVLYNWPAAASACPAGWHLPSDDEWTILVEYLIANGYNYDDRTTGNKVAKALATGSGWDQSSNRGAVGNNDYPSKQNATGFSAPPAGYRHDRDGFRSAGRFTAWWSLSNMNASGDWCRTLNFYGSELYRGGINKSTGFSVRCIRND
jgi:uncharacterized protein (TIGR02145 family)